MRKLIKREFEICTSEGVCVVVCTSMYDGADSKACVEELDKSDFLQKYPYMKLFEYDVSMDVDKMEEYKIIRCPKILVFKNGSLVKNFQHKNLDETIFTLSKIKDVAIDPSMIPPQ